MKQKRPVQVILSLIVLSSILASCSALQPEPTATPAPTFTPTPTFPLPEGLIVFEKSQGRKFAGTVHGHGETAIILANMTTGGEAQWDSFVEAFDREKFSVLTFGYLQADFPGAYQETNIVLKRLRASGYQRVICIGASLGVTACASIARQPELIGIVLVAGPNNGGSLAEVTYPKLFVAGALDQWARDTQLIHDQAADPKTLVLYPDNAAHGADLFYSPDRDAFLALLLEFVEGLVAP